MDVSLYINGIDATQTWGVSLEDAALSILLTPAPLKPFVENKSPQENGKSIYPKNPRLDERDISLPLLISARTKEEFIVQYYNFVAELQKGVIGMRVICGDFDVTYSLTYLSCQPFNEYYMQAGKFLLRLNEPNPTNREVR